MNITYCHIEEFGNDRYNLLPIMAYCFNHCVIWAPNMEKLDIAHKEERSFFLSRDVLELIENGNIQVIAREPWYYKEERLKPKRFQSHGWLEGIDNRLRDYAIEDRGKPIVERRVIIAPRERGIEFAERIMGSHKKEDIELIDYIRKQKEVGNLPKRIIELIYAEKLDDDAAIKFILRSSYNNNDAFKMSKAEIPTMADRPDVFLKCMEYCDLGYRSINQDISIERVANIVESLKIIMTLNKNSLTSKKFRKIIEKSDRPQFIIEDFMKLAEFAPMECSENTMLSVIASFMNHDLKEYKENRKPTLYDFTTIASLLFSIACYGISIGIQSTISMGLGVFTSIPAIKRLGNPVLSNPSIHLPYLFAYGTDKPNYWKMKTLYNAINEEINNTRMK